MIKVPLVDLLQSYVSLNFYHKNKLNLDQKVNPQQNTVCLEQKQYASPDNFTPALLVMLDTFRRSVSTLNTTLNSEQSKQHTVSVSGRDKGYTVKYNPLSEGVLEGKA